MFTHHTVCCVHAHKRSLLLVTARCACLLSLPLLPLLLLLQTLSDGKPGMLEVNKTLTACKSTTDVHLCCPSRSCCCHRHCQMASPSSSRACTWTQASTSKTSSDEASSCCLRGQQHPSAQRGQHAHQQQQQQVAAQGSGTA
jgi:hypothetical protein